MKTYDPTESSWQRTGTLSWVSRWLGVFPGHLLSYGGDKEGNIHMTADDYRAVVEEGWMTGASVSSVGEPEMEYGDGPEKTRPRKLVKMAMDTPAILLKQTGVF